MNNIAQRLPYITGILVVVIIFFNSCKGKTREKPTVELETKKIDSVNMEEPLLNIIYSIPEPDEILSEIFSEDLILKSGINCSLDKSAELFSFNSIALFMGVIITDMTYLVVQDRRNSSLSYYKTIVELSDRLELNFFRSTDITHEVEQNIDNRDALLAVYKEAIVQIRHELDFTKREKALALVYTGSLSESLYLAISNIDSNNLHNISYQVYKQYTVIKNLNSFFELINTSSDIIPIISLLKEIEYLMYEGIGKNDEVSETGDGESHLHFFSKTKYIYNEQNFSILKGKIIELRELIINKTS